MNLKVRFKNKTWTVSFLLTIVALIYQILGLFEIVPSVSQETIGQIVGLVANMLVGVGVLIDPTTPGFMDGEQK